MTCLDASGHLYRQDVSLYAGRYSRSGAVSEAHWSLADCPPGFETLQTLACKLVGFASLVSPLIPSLVNNITCAAV